MLKDLYFQWMVDQVPYDGRAYKSYTKLLTRLNETPFQYCLDRDENRLADGIDMRFDFAFEMNIPAVDISNEMDSIPCSVLEVMLALARRSENIMTDEMEGDRTKKWFWDMVESLGLLGQDDLHYSEPTVDHHLFIFLNRQYSTNGHGGLVTIRNTDRDLRDVEIWYQQMWHLDENS